MSFMVSAMWQLYRNAFRATVHSLTRGWLTIIAVMIFAGLMIVATQVVSPLGMLGGFILGAVNALLIGATLGLIQQAVSGARRITMHDIWESFGQYFWDVIGVGFVLWIPMLLLDRGMAANPNGPLIGAAIFLLLFILLNPAPEVIYQVCHDSPLDVLRESYEFVIENWIEWFLPLAIVIAPLGLSFFFGLSSRLGRGAGLDFFQVLIVPFMLLTAWLGYLGVPVEAGWLLVLLTPPVAVAMLLFRGHLFAALHGTSRRQRMYRQRFSQEP
ncbi:MAG: hypothetical protein ACREJU_13665 [Nitrospiraceae bacterium]